MLEGKLALSESLNVVAGGEVTQAETDLIILKAAFSSCESRYQFEIRSNGSGKIFYPDSFSDSEDIFHEVDFSLLVREIEEQLMGVLQQEGNSSLEKSEIDKLRREIVAEKLEEIFWEEINPTLDDPFYRSFDDESEWGEEFYCEQGTTEEFQSFLKLCVLTERKISDSDDYLLVDAETECEASGLNDCGYTSERLSELVEIACHHFKPAGHNYTYNDGWGDRYSGYSMNSESISISLKESALTPVREKILAMVRLRDKLTEMGVAADKIIRLTTF